MDAQFESWIGRLRDSHGRLTPPWRALPGIAPQSIGWRMGLGEDYLDLWRREFALLSPQEQEAYRSAHRAPPHWFWFYWDLSQPSPIGCLTLIAVYSTFPVRYAYWILYSFLTSSPPFPDEAGESAG